MEDQALQLLMGGDELIRSLLSEGLFVAARRRDVFIAVRDAPSVRDAVDMLGADEADLLRELAASEDEDLDAGAVASRLLGRAANRLARDLEAQARATGDIAAVAADVKYLRQWAIDLREPRGDLSELLPLAEWLAMKNASEAA